MWTLDRWRKNHLHLDKNKQSATNKEPHMDRRIDTPTYIHIHRYLLPSLSVCTDGGTPNLLFEKHLPSHGDLEVYVVYLMLDIHPHTETA